MNKYKELGGSPLEQYDQKGFTAQREFLVPWEQRQAFAEKVLGSAAIPPVNQVLNYPGKDRTIAYRLKFEPLDPAAIKDALIENLQEHLPDYSGSLLKATVYYQSVDDDDRNDVPNTQPGSWISYKMSVDVIEETVSLGQWKWSDNASIAVDPELTGIKRIPVTVHHVTWNRVVGPPWSTISTMQGKVNSDSFLGCAAGTLLFEGAVGNKLYHKGDSVGDLPSAFTWQLLYVFREKSVKYGGEIFGWNHFYRSDPVGWLPLVHQEKMLYEAADFDLLFISE